MKKKTKIISSIVMLFTLLFVNMTISVNATENDSAVSLIDLFEGKNAIINGNTKLRREYFKCWILIFT